MINSIETLKTCINFLDNFLSFKVINDHYYLLSPWRQQSVSWRTLGPSSSYRSPKRGCVPYNVSLLVHHEAKFRSNEIDISKVGADHANVLK